MELLSEELEVANWDLGAVLSFPGRREDVKT
jgi:hypothetical protein